MTEAVAIIAFDHGRVLLIRSRKRPGSVEIPCGSLQPGETLFEGAARELFEETGLTAEAWHALPIIHKTVREHLVYFVWLTKWTGTLRAGDDAEAAFWGDPDWIREGSHPEDYEIVTRLQTWRKERER